MLPPKVSILTSKTHKRCGGKPPVPHIASRLLYLIIKTKKAKFCSCGKKNLFVVKNLSHESH
jgi:hypothetical protein